MADSLQIFHPLIRQWFQHSVGHPTDVQARSWPVISQNKHLLISAPTGSGKTLTAFLWTIDQFLRGNLETGLTRVIYISPLKALNYDIQRNLLGPLGELKELARSQAMDFPEIRVLTRSGDTDQGDRRRMLRSPPEILITTPESLNLLLTAKGSQVLLNHINTLIVDEIHSIANNKRGVYLMSAVERLVQLSGEFQRIALSATINPLEKVAEFAGGYQLDRERPDYYKQPHYKRRQVSIIHSDMEKKYLINVRYPEETANRSYNEKVWDSLAVDFCEKISTNQSTLLFVNSRALCEKLTFKINTLAGKTLAYAHHGSLSKEIRLEVERKLKAGELAAIVATSSLELGIDIGDLDEVILVQSPGSVSSAIQRIGRAGHGTGEVSKCTIYPTHPHDFIEASVLTRAVLDRNIEAVSLIDCPLDVLSQILVSATAVTEQNLEKLFAEIKCCQSFHNLSWTQFELVVNMLSGRYAGHRIRELQPRVDRDPESDTIKARPGAVMSFYLSGGVIPDRGYYQLRLKDSNARVGELDEEFVWEAKTGQVFTFGTRDWVIKDITPSDVLVTPATQADSSPPFWKAESLNRDFHYSELIGNFLESANQALKDNRCQELLETEHLLEPLLAKELTQYLCRQREHCQEDLPHRHHLIMETTQAHSGKYSGYQTILHSNWGSSVNRPLAMILEAGFQEKYGERLEIFVSNEALVIQLPENLSAREIFDLIPLGNLEALLRTSLEGSGFFGARFRENAGRALLLSKKRFNERKPLWMSRLQARNLMDSVLRFPDFPILLETWRTCLRDEFDLASLQGLLTEIQSGEIRISEVTTATPSPFAQHLSWDQINLYMYEDDSPRGARVSSLNEDLLKEVVFAPGLRPAIAREIIDRLEEKLQRRLPGYVPETDEALVQWVKERTLIPLEEWKLLQKHRQKDKRQDTDLLNSQLCTLVVKHTRLIAVREDLHAITTAGLYGDKANLAIESLTDGHLDPIAKTAVSNNEATSPTPLLENWLQFYGPLTLMDITRLMGTEPDSLLPQLQALVDEKILVTGELVAGSTDQCWCDSQNYEILLRLRRQLARPAFETLPSKAITPFLYQWQTQFNSQDAKEQLFDTIERLRIYPARASLWESEYLPARLQENVGESVQESMQTYDTDFLNQLFQEGMIHWIGMGKEKCLFSFTEDLDLVFTEPPAADKRVRNLLPDPSGRYAFGKLLDHSDLSAVRMADELWQLCWESQISNDSMGALRKGIENRFKVPDASQFTAANSRRPGRRGYQRWRGSIPFAGNWYQLDWPSATGDLLEKEELNKDRVRLLLDRYGILFRELITRELPGFNWSSLFRSLRLMELSGEIISGHFFEDIPGLQFIAPAALRLLQAGLSKNLIFWLNATDPISSCGLDILPLKQALPRRLEGTHLMYHGVNPVLISEKKGKVLTFNVAEDDPNLQAYLGLLKHLLYRKFQPLKNINIETINDVPAVHSEYLDALRVSFDLVTDHKSVTIQKTFQ